MISKCREKEREKWVAIIILPILDPKPIIKQSETRTAICKRNNSIIELRSLLLYTSLTALKLLSSGKLESDEKVPVVKLGFLCFKISNVQPKTMKVGKFLSGCVFIIHRNKPNRAAFIYSNYESRFLAGVIIISLSLVTSL